MVKQKLYKYMGYNGTITSLVLLPGIDHLELIELKANDGKYLTDGKRKVYSIIIPIDEMDNWVEKNRNTIE